MPVTPTYPGVYVNELTSSVHTITGVPTSIAAFVGPAAQGPVGVAIQVNSWADFERAFGGLDATSEMTYAVYQFFLNGGATAQVVRAASSTTAPSNANVVLSGTLDTAPFLALEAISGGSWADDLTVTVSPTAKLGAPSTAPATPSATPSADPQTTLTQYDLTVSLLNGPTETYLGVSTAAGDPQGLVNQLRSSALVTLYTGSDPTIALAATGKTPTPVTNKGTDGDAPSLDDLTNAAKTALANVDIFNMLCVPDAANAAWVPTTQAAYDYVNTLQNLAEYCQERKAILLVDPPEGWPAANSATVTLENQLLLTGGDGSVATNAAIYYPRVSAVDPKTGVLRQFGPSGTMAGVYAATDAARGVWKAPAGTTASLTGVVDLEKSLNDADNGEFNPIGVNCLRNFPIYGPVSWGARTTAGSDLAASQWKYVPIRRLALFVEESLRRGTKWVVFEPNDEPLWSSIRLNVGSFLNGLYRQGAFQGSTPQQAYLVKCDKENNPQSQIDQGIVNILVGFAPLKPAEFVFINIEQLAGDLAG